jgi:hypothetical protein
MFVCVYVFGQGRKPKFRTEAKIKEMSPQLELAWENEISAKSEGRGGEAGLPIHDRLLTVVNLK